MSFTEAQVEQILMSVGNRGKGEWNSTLLADRIAEDIEKGFGVLVANQFKDIYSGTSYKGYDTADACFAWALKNQVKKLLDYKFNEVQISSVSRELDGRKTNLVVFKAKSLKEEDTE